MFERARDKRLSVRCWLLATVLVALISGSPLPAKAGFDAHGGPVKGIAVSKDGTRALTASFDYSIILWNLVDGAIMAEFHGHEAAVNAVTFLPDGKRALSASDDGKVGIWDLASGKALALLEGHFGKVVALAVSPDGDLAASVGWDQRVRLWDLGTMKPSQALSGSANLNAVLFSKSGKRLVVGSSDGSLDVWRLEDSVRGMTWKAHDFAITGLAASPDGRIIATSSVDETVQLWDQEAGEALQTLYGHVGPVLAVALSQDGELVASGGVDGTVRVWRRGDGDRLKVYARHRGAVWAVAFAPDGRTLLSGGADGLVLTYDLEDDEEARGQQAAASGGFEPPARKTTADRGEKLFKTCIACHTTGPDGGHRAGPTLHGVFGRKAGSHPDYRYSETLVQSDLIWTEETIDRLFAIGPDQLLPGTKMPLQQMPDAQDRADLIAFLKRVTAP